MEGKGKKAVRAVTCTLCAAALYATVTGMENRIMDSTVKEKAGEMPEILRVTDEMAAETGPERKAGGKEGEENPQTRIFTLCDVDLDAGFQLFLQELCRDYGLDYPTMVAMAETESGFDPQAVGADGELGMYQIMPSTAAEAEEALGRRLNLFDAYDNAEAAAWLMAHYTDKYGDTVSALMVYSMGETGARRCMENGIPRSKYAACVMERAAGYGYRVYREADSDV